MLRLRCFGWTVLAATLVPGLLPAAENRIVQAVDPNRTTVLKGRAARNARSFSDLGPMPAATVLSYATLRLRPAPGLEAFLAEQRAPGSRNYHRWLTPEQFGERFGLSVSDIGQLVSWLQSAGLQVHDVARGRQWITFSGTAGQVGRAFHTEIHRYQANGAIHFANSADPSIPSAFEDVVSDVDGLDDFGPQPLFQLEKTGTPPTDPQLNSGGSHAIAPDDFATIYNVTPLYQAGFDGTGQKIAVIGESAILAPDIQQFRQSFHLPASAPQVVLFGRDPGINNALVEAELDIEWAGAVARNATIVYVYLSSVNTATQYAIDQNLAPVVTFSFGGCESYSSVALRAIAQQANAQGITWVAASGDVGAATCDLTSPTPEAAKGPSASFPADIPEITAVGGTEFDDGNGTFWAATNNANAGSALSYVPEKAWNDSVVRNDLSASGGGPSLLFSKPDWQTGPGVPNDNARDVPDVALAASPQHYPYLIYSLGTTLGVGGTSVSSPAFAGLLALLNQYLAANGAAAPEGLGNINPTLYRLAQASSGVFHDITTGDTFVLCEQSSPGCSNAGMGYAAGAGYDMATGLGSVDAYRLVTQWQRATATNTTITAAPSAISLSDTVQLTATVTGGGGVPTGAVTFLADDISVGSAALTASGTATLMVPALSLAAGNGTVTGLYGGDSEFDGSAGSTGITVTLPGSGSLVVPYVTPNPVTQAGPTWPYTVGLVEKAGVATTLTSFTINGVNQNLGFWTGTHIAANGTISASLSGSGLSVPLNRVFLFSGSDANGRTWTQQLTVPFLADPTPTLLPSMTLSGAPNTVRQNPRADASCQWPQRITVQETGGFLVELANLVAGGIDVSGQIQQLFGTTRLAPYGMLQASFCWNNVAPPATKTLQLTGISELGTPLTVLLSTTFGAAADAPPDFSVSPAEVDVSPGGTASIAVQFSGAGAAWTASVLPANRTSSWLTIAPASGSGAGQVTLQASANGLANGVYRAFVSISAPDAIPSAVSVPVTLVVGASSSMGIVGLRDNASGTIAFAPGMTVAVYGSQLAGSTEIASRIPIPFRMEGLTATVNGVSAPVYAVSSGQVNIQIPYETGLGPAVLAINNNGGVATFTFPVAVAAPGIYNFFIDDTTGVWNSANPGDVMTMFLTGAGDLAPSLATGATPSPLTPIANLPAPRLPVTLTVGGEPAVIAFVGNASGLVGVMQLNFTLPADLAPGMQQVVVTVGGIASDPVNLAVTAP